MKILAILPKNWQMCPFLSFRAKFGYFFNDLITKGIFRFKNPPSFGTKIAIRKMKPKKVKASQIGGAYGKKLFFYNCPPLLEENYILHHYLDFIKGLCLEKRA